MASLIINPSVSIRLDELRFQYSRSSGPGGQNVNRVSTKVELYFDIDASTSLTDEQRQMLRNSLARRIDSKGTLRITVQESRSQWKNKQLAIEYFREVLERALRPHKKRKKTVTPHGSREERLRAKKQRSTRKKMRRPTFNE